MNSNITIRSARKEDCLSVFPLAKEMATSFEVERTFFEESFHEVLEDESSTCLVAEQKEGIIGYLIGFDHRAFYANGRVSWVEEIFVKDEFRKDGIGNNLMAVFEQWCLDRNSKLIGLATRRASQFYNAIGYEESAIFFRKRLNPNKTDHAAWGSAAPRRK